MRAKWFLWVLLFPFCLFVPASLPLDIWSESDFICNALYLEIIFLPSHFPFHLCHAKIGCLCQSNSLYRTLSPFWASPAIDNARFGNHRIWNDLELGEVEGLKWCAPRDPPWRKRLLSAPQCQRCQSDRDPSISVPMATPDIIGGNENMAAMCRL